MHFQILKNPELTLTIFQDFYDQIQRVRSARPRALPLPGTRYVRKFSENAETWSTRAGLVDENSGQVGGLKIYVKLSASTLNRNLSSKTAQ